MEACNMVERELDKVLLKLTDINDQAGAVLQDLINEIETLKRELDEGNDVFSFFIFNSLYFLETGNFHDSNYHFLC